MMGHVNEKTDAFSYGIVLLELLSDLSGMGARQLLEIELEDLTAAELQQQQCVAKHRWPERVLSTLSTLISQCTAPLKRDRGTTIGVMPVLEALLQQQQQ